VITGAKLRALLAWLGTGRRRILLASTGAALAVAMVTVTALAGFGEVTTIAEPPHEAVSSIPEPTGTTEPVPPAGITPATIAPTTTTPVPPAGGGTVLTGGAPTRLTFGMHVSQLAADAWPSVSVGTFRIWNGDSTWGALEPRPGEWNFARLDARVEQARARGASVLLVLSHPPGWASSRPDLQGYNGSPAPPRDIAQWRNYVATVAARYAGRIEAYEIWNEPNLAQFFVGSPQQLGELTRVAADAINSVDSRALVVSAGFSARTGGAESYFRAYVASGIASAVDVVGIHIYPYPGNGPESMVGLAQRFRSIANGAGLSGKPMWNTEIGYGRSPDYLVSESAAASLVLRTYLVLPAAGLVRNYWYMWDDREFVGLYMVGADRRSPTAAAYRFEEAQRWLSGAQLDSCRESGGLWVCTLVHTDGPTVSIAWSTSGEHALAVPPGATIAYDFGGDDHGVSAGAAHTVGATPVLFAPAALPSLG
jgi:hypothetical protein